MCFHGFWSVAGGLAALGHDISKVAGIAGIPRTFLGSTILKLLMGPASLVGREGTLCRAGSVSVAHVKRAIAFVGDDVGRLAGSKVALDIVGGIISKIFAGWVVANCDVGDRFRLTRERLVGQRSHIARQHDVAIRHVHSDAVIKFRRLSLGLGRHLNTECGGIQACVCCGCGKPQWMDRHLSEVHWLCARQVDWLGRTAAGLHGEWRCGHQGDQRRRRQRRHGADGASIDLCIKVKCYLCPGSAVIAYLLAAEAA